MGNTSTKDGTSEDLAPDNGAISAVVQAPDKARVKNGSSALQAFSGVADMISSEGQASSPKANVVSRYQQFSGAHGKFLHDSTMVSQTPSSKSASSSHPNSTATTPSIIATQSMHCATDELGQAWMHLSPSMDKEPQLQGHIATLFEWRHGGSDVCMEGSWDNWGTRIPLLRAENNFTIVKFLPAGIYDYRFLVDGVWRHAPELPCTHDQEGNEVNIVTVQSYVPENLEGVEDCEPPGSPDSSYNSPVPGCEDYSKDPPLLPSQLYHNNELERVYQRHLCPMTAQARPHHVVLNHLFVETRKAAASPILTLGLTQRFRGKYTTVILHKPITRR